MIYLNGESKDSAVQCFGSNLNELMENAKLKLNLMQPIQALFTEHGELVKSDFVKKQNKNFLFL